MKNKGLIKEDLIIIVAGLILLAIIFLVSYLFPRETEDVLKETEDVIVILDGSDYSIGDKIILSIKNNLDNSICFSSCYPYYIERENELLRDYRYQECKKENLVESCINSNDKKAFEIDIPKVDYGEHRIALPACIGCALNDLFKESDRFYSDIFNVVGPPIK